MSVLVNKLVNNKQSVSEIHDTILGVHSMHKSNKKFCINVGPWMLHFQAMAHLKREVPSGVYGATLKVLCMLQQLIVWQRVEDGC
jgi:hypothetical protein